MHANELNKKKRFQIFIIKDLTHKINNLRLEALFINLLLLIQFVDTLFYFIIKENLPILNCKQFRVTV